MPTTAPAIPATMDPVEVQVLLMRKDMENNHGNVMGAVDRVGGTVVALREDVARNYVDKVTHEKLEGRVTSIEGKVTSQGGIFTWGARLLIGGLVTGGFAVLFKLSHG